MIAFSQDHTARRRDGAYPMSQMSPVCRTRNVDHPVSVRMVSALNEPWSDPVAWLLPISLVTFVGLVTYLVRVRRRAVHAWENCRAVRLHRHGLERRRARAHRAFESAVSEVHAESVRLDLVNIDGRLEALEPLEEMMRQRHAAQASHWLGKVLALPPIES